ncbi:MAG: 30S ribosomal protein S6 [Gemmataceae bacterium]|nr:30S ribosomal protein S6 [Gemmataceae bacterium]
MREYELTVVYDLAVTESGGADASVQHLTHAVEARGGNVIRVDHWGRRRFAYPIGRALDGDYVVSRVNLDPASITALEAGLRIDERVYRFLVVRADELPPPPAPREPRRAPEPAAVAAAPVGAPAAVAEAAPATVAEPVAVEEAAPAMADATPGVAESPATAAEAAAMGEAEASPEAVPAEDAPEPGSAPPSGTVAAPSD